MMACARVQSAPVPTPGVAFRSITPRDTAALQAFHRRLSPDTIRNRFFGAHPELSDPEAHRFTHLTAGEQVAIVAVVGDDIIAVGRYSLVGHSDAAEVAFVVEDGHQYQGVGRELLLRLAHIGWESGIRRFVADTFASNHPMIAVFTGTPAAVSVTSTRRDGSVVHVTMAVSAPAP